MNESRNVGNREKARALILSTITKCEAIQPKFAVGTSSHTLLKNRIKALYIAKKLMDKEDDLQTDALAYDVLSEDSLEEIKQGLRPIQSIIQKCKKGQSKFEEETPHFVRFQNIIDAMTLANLAMEEEIQRRSKGRNVINNRT